MCAWGTSRGEKRCESWARTCVRVCTLRDMHTNVLQKRNKFPETRTVYLLQETKRWRYLLPETNYKTGDAKIVFGMLCLILRVNFVNFDADVAFLFIRLWIKRVCQKCINKKEKKKERTICPLFMLILLWM